MVHEKKTNHVTQWMTWLKERGWIKQLKGREESAHLGVETAYGEQLVPKHITFRDITSYLWHHRNICSCGEGRPTQHKRPRLLRFTLAINPQPLEFLVGAFFTLFNSTTSNDCPSPVWRMLCPPWHLGCLLGCMCVSSGCCCCCCCLCWCVLTQLCPPRCPRWESGRCLTAETSRHLRASRQSRESKFSLIHYQSHLWNKPFILEGGCLGVTVAKS